jgi:hypothetical protein
MENFITGFPANESAMRAAVCDVIGESKYELVFERLLTFFFDDDDTQLLADIGLNGIRVPVNYGHFENDSCPFEIKEEGFRHLDPIIDLCAERALPGHAQLPDRLDDATGVLAHGLGLTAERGASSRSASIGSLLPSLWRACGCGWLASTTVIPQVRSSRTKPVARAPVDSTPTRSICPCPRSHAISRA